jgi:uncharacterized protein (TIGR00369 family)
VGVFHTTLAMTVTGLEYMRALTAGTLGPRATIMETMGMSSAFNLDYGQVSVEAQPADFLMNPLGVLHGGFAATLLDTVLGIAVHTALPPATGYTTAELKVNYTRAILPTTERLRADGKLIYLGRKMATSEGRLVGVDTGKLYAHGSSTCFLFPLLQGSE